MKNRIGKLDVADLRKKAEKKLVKKSSEDVEAFTKAETLKQIHELEVYQIELEMQNDELMLAKEQAVIATDKYIELYDFAPSVFITLSPSGKIDRITLRGAQMLGKERSELFYYTFDTFVKDESKPVFKDFFNKISSNKNKESCNVTLKANENTFYVQIDGMGSENGRQRFMSITDITKRVIAEQALFIANEELAIQNVEKEKRAAELVIANQELLFQNKEKEKRAAELILANEELAFQNEEKEKRAAELIIANKELIFQNEEKEKRAAELVIANQKLELFVLKIGNLAAIVESS
jgi:hypothetical protein